MNYYRFYVGDYLRDTARLSMLEHGAYSLLLGHYYAEELPIPPDMTEVYTMVRAMTPADRKAVDKVLERYFTKQPDGYHNARADKEIAVSKQARDNGKRGGRPRTESETGCDTETGTGYETGHETGMITGGITDEGGGSGHPPTTNHQPPASKPPTARVNGAARRHSLPDGFGISERVSKWAGEHGFSDYLQEHFETFMLYVESNQPKYANWDSAFMRCVRDDWGNVRRKAGGKPPIKSSVRPSITCSMCGQKAFTWTDGKCNPCWRGEQGLAA